MQQKGKKDIAGKIIETVFDAGRVTLREAAKIAGVSQRTARRYLTEAVRIAGLYRSAKHGVFVSQSAYFDWCAAQGKARYEADEVAGEPRFMMPYNPARNAICIECRQSPTMQRVLTFYGAAQ